MSDSLRTIATRAEENGNGDGREPILPPREQAAELIPPRDGVARRISGDARALDHGHVRGAALGQVVSGAQAERPGADAVQREGYSHEVSSAGFWTGGASGVDEPVFYSYMAPEPAGFYDARVSPGAAIYLPQLGEFLLSYEEVRQSRSPRDTLLSFMESTYEAGANLAKWDRAALEKERPNS